MSCSTSAVPFRAKGSSWVSVESSAGTASAPIPRSASFAAVRTHQRRSASSLVIDGAASAPTTCPTARAAWTRTNHSESSSRATRPSRRLVRVANRASRRQRLARSDRCPTSARSASIRRGRGMHAAASRPRSEQPGWRRGAAARASARRRRQSLELGRDARAEPLSTPKRIEQQLDRPVVADVTERSDRRDDDVRIGVDEHAPQEPRDGRIPRLLEALERRDAAPSAALGARRLPATAGRRRLAWAVPTSSARRGGAADERPKDRNPGSQSARARRDRVARTNSCTFGRRRRFALARPSNGGSRGSLHNHGRRAGRIALPMRMRGLEPPRPYGHTDLNRARLPIPPHPRGRTILALGRLTPR